MVMGTLSYIFLYVHSFGEDPLVWVWAYSFIYFYMFYIYYVTPQVVSVRCIFL